MIYLLCMSSQLTELSIRFATTFFAGRINVSTCSPPRIFQMAIFGQKASNIFGKSLDLGGGGGGQAMEKIFRVQEISAPWTKLVLVYIYAYGHPYKLTMAPPPTRWLCAYHRTSWSNDLIHTWTCMQADDIGRVNVHFQWHYSLIIIYCVLYFQTIYKQENVNMAPVMKSCTTVFIFCLLLFRWVKILILTEFAFSSYNKIILIRVKK